MKWAIPCCRHRIIGALLDLDLCHKTYLAGSFCRWASAHQDGAIITDKNLVMHQQTKLLEATSSPRCLARLSAMVPAWLPGVAEAVRCYFESRMSLDDASG
jgi:hypothetical protein